MLASPIYQGCGQGASRVTSRNYSRSLTPLQIRTSLPVAQACHDWVIEDFVARTEAMGTSVSTRFSVPVCDSKGIRYETVWRLKAYPRGCDQEHKNFFSVFINQVSGPVVFLRYSLSLEVNQNLYDRPRHLTTTRKGTVQFTAEGRSSSRGWKKFLALESIISPSSPYLHDGSVIVKCSLDIEKQEGTLERTLLSNHVSHHSSASLSSTRSVTETPATTKDDDFKDRKYCDMTLVVDTTGWPRPSGSVKELPCHRYMLGKKSDVFDAMFSHDFVENKVNRVTITDLEPDAVQEMLRWMYTGKVENLPKVHRSLLVAADKYNVVELRETCERYLCDSIRIDNVADLCLFAHARNSDTLLKSAIAFIASNVEAVTHTEGWNELSRHPELMTIIVRTMGPRV